MILLKDMVLSCHLEEQINNSYSSSEAMANGCRWEPSNSNSPNSVPFSTEGCGKNVQEDWKDGCDDAVCGGINRQVLEF